jgi:hypothetical protein
MVRMVKHHYVPLIRVLAVDTEDDFVLMLTVDFQGDDGPPGLLWAQHAHVLGPKDRELPWFIDVKVLVERVNSSCGTHVSMRGGVRTTRY